jgi:putative membrane protein
MAILWVKALHIIFVTSWFAGLFYLPRIFVNLAMVPAGPQGQAERERLLLMSRKLYRFMMPLMIGTLFFGFWLWLGFGIGQGPGNGWMHAKLAIVFSLVGYHHVCGAILKKFQAGTMTKSHIWFRWFNEIPVLMLLGAVILVVVKPF